MLNPGDRIARALHALDAFPRLARRALMVLIPLLLVAALVGAFAIAPSGGGGGAATRQTVAHQPSAEPRLVPPSRRPPIKAAREPALSSATDAALGFLRGYLAYSYGRGTLDAIRGADRRLIASLRHSHPRVPPAARQRHPEVTTLQIVAQAPGAAQATATVADGSGPQYPLVLYLDRRPGGWIVTRLGDD